MVVDLSKYQSKDSKVFSGRPYGEKLRKELMLDEYDDLDEKVIVKIPEDTFSMNSSFFLGLFSNSIRKLGELEFREKYNFECSELIMEDVDEGIKRALKNSNVLD